MRDLRAFRAARGFRLPADFACLHRRDVSRHLIFVLGSAAHAGIAARYDFWTSYEHDITNTTSLDVGFLLDGKWHKDGEPIEIRSPGTGQLVGVTYRASAKNAEAAIAAAVRAFEVTRKLGGYERQRILRAIASGIEKQRDEFARIMALEAGKPLKASRVEVDRAIFTFSVAAEEAVRVGGEFLPLDWQASTAGRWGIVRRFPLGPIAAITPFNFPINLVAHKLAPAIAAGCTIVLKPAPQTPFTALRLARIIEEAGWPAGGLNVLSLSNDDAGLIISDDRIKLLSFTAAPRSAGN